MSTKPSDDEPIDRERHATNLELFLDLVFVFAVTQITSLVAHDLTWPGIGRAAVVAVLVWWQWSQFAWAGAAVDLQRQPGTRLLVLSTIPATLVMAVAIPSAFTSAGRWFGAAYLVVQLLVLAMQGAEAVKVAATRRAFLIYTSVASISPLLVMVGGFLDGDARAIAWVAAIVINLVAAVRAAAEGEWTINPGHFTERHALFVIIALGEVLVAVGGTASGLGLDGRVLLGLVVAVAGACVIWWTYFAFIPHAIEHALAATQGGARGALARDVFTLGHLPIVVGLIAYAVVVKHLVVHATDRLAAADRGLLASAVVLVVGAYTLIAFRVRGVVWIERPAAIAICGLWCALAASVPAAAVVGVVAVVLAVMQSISWRRFRRGALAHVTPNR